MPDDKQEIKTEQHGDKLFYLEQAMKYVVDAYDEYMGSIEASHYEALNFFNVVGFRPLDIKTIDTVDFTWMNNNDVIDIQKKPDNQMILENVTKIIVNMDNIQFMYISGIENYELDINNNNSKMSIMDQYKGIKTFLRYNASRISSIKLDGFNPVANFFLSRLITENEIRIIKEEEEYIKY